MKYIKTYEDIKQRPYDRKLFWTLPTDDRFIKSLKDIGCSNDTLYNTKDNFSEYYNYLSNINNKYIFRNCKFRRWETLVDDWGSETTYTTSDFVNYQGFIYKSIKYDNINNEPSNESDYWIQLLDLSLTTYWNNNQDSVNNILSNPEVFADFKTFAEITGTTTLYELCCRSNHFEGFKDNNNNGEINGTILSNNVFFLQDNNYFGVFSNSIAAESCGNTIGNYFNNNTIGNYFNSNTIGSNFNSNTIGSNFNFNTIGSNFISNTIGNIFFTNTIGNYFMYNTISNYFHTNTINNNLNSNTIGNYFQYNTIGNNFYYNTIFNSISKLIITTGAFQMNVIKDNIDFTNIDFSEATHVYNNYNTEILKTPGPVKLIYVDDSGVQQIVDVTT
jgi:hypothetical protein